MNPQASTPAVTARMRNQPTRGTAPERAVLAALHDFGVPPPRLHHRPVPGLRRTADIAWPARRLAVLVDGCFWHGCPRHHRRTTANRDWWDRKIARNRERDRDTDRRLEQAGWTVVRHWEHDDPHRTAALARYLHAVLGRPCGRRWTAPPP